VLDTPVLDAHGLAPDAIFAMLTSMDCRPGRTLVVACEPADVSPGMGLSDQVRAALPHAVRAVETILTDQAEGLAQTTQTNRKAGVHDGDQAG
jgi:hydrogenase maturation protease